MQKFEDRHFQKYSLLIYNTFGISLNESKKDKLQHRISKLMAKRDIKSFDAFYDILAKGTDKLLFREFTNEITVNKTEFFREADHFDFIRNKINDIVYSNPRIQVNKEIRVWSSACSTGEEAYSLAITLKECLPQNIEIKILATDINDNVLKRAQEGIYSPEEKLQISRVYLSSYFENHSGGIKVRDEIKSLVTFRLFNLMNPFPFKNTFDIIFCRNVMIYFDTKTQEYLLAKFYDTMHPGALLFVGHSETLSNKNHRFRSIQPTIYTK